jgi:protein-tyrosine kinase
MAVQTLPGEEPDDLRYEISPEVVALVESRSAETEAIRTMRIHIMARHLGDGRRGLTVCAPTAGCGCTYTAVNLAASLAQLGVSTLLVDADLRNPAVQTFIKPSSEPIGVRGYIESGALDMSEYIHSEVLPNLSIMYAGGAAENAQELLGRESFKDMIETCLRDFDVTIVDTPPAKNYADARRISSLVGYGAIVAKRNVSLMQDISSVAEQMQEDGVQLVGTVLNET